MKKGQMPGEIIDLKTIEQLLEDLETTPEEFRSAQRRALKATAKTVSIFVGRELAAKLLMPLALVQSRVKPYQAKARGGEFYRQAVVMYAFPFPEVLRGKGSPENPNAFRGGKGRGKIEERFYRRQGEARNPLFQEKVRALDEFKDEAIGMETMIMALFRKKLTQEIKYVSGLGRRRKSN